MDREFLLALLVGMITSATVVCCGWLPARAPFAHDAGADAERRAWWRLLLPLAPTALGLAFLLGWALVEPDDAEPATPAAWGPFAFIAIVWLRAWGRAALALTAAGAASTRIPVAVGLLRPRVVVPAELAEAFSEDEHAAVVAHEEAHVEHRDPLRIWLAQLAADLQWPWPAAAARLSRWLEALEWARDDEARLRGADGEALASALLVTVRRCTAARRSHAVAALTGNERALEARVHRLVEPLRAASRPTRAHVAVGATVGAGAVAIGAGMVLGEGLVRAVLGAL